MTRPVVAFFGSTLSAGTPRGALRLFRGLAGELAKRDDIELVCIGDYLSDSNDPVGCVYRCFDGRAFVAGLERGASALQSLAKVEPESEQQSEVATQDAAAETPGEASDMRTDVLEAALAPEAAAPVLSDASADDHPDEPPAGGMRAAYRRVVPLAVRELLHPIAVWIVRLLSPRPVPPAAQPVASWPEGDQARLEEPPVEPSAESPASPADAEAGLPEGLFAPVTSEAGPFDNTQVVGKVISLDRVDVLLNFWWFHSPFANPLIGRYRPANLRVISWFLDAIPLRVPHWQPGMIPVPEFRAAVQYHLEIADEVVGISRSAVEDVHLFFPHIRKPVHFVPCGIFDDDFVQPEGSAVLRHQLGLDLALPLFIFIGFQEPSKNVLYGVRGLLEMSKRTGREVQALIVGFAPGLNLADAFGPLASELAGRVRIISGGVIDETAKRYALSQATALVYPSKWEGFGIPPLEAMAAGTPLVVSDIPPLRETCIDLAEYCDPYDVNDIAAALQRVLEMTPQRRAAYAARARAHVAGYSWKAATDKLMALVLDESATVAAGTATASLVD